MSDGKQIWVALELRRGQETPGFHGTLAEADFDALIAGTYTQPFVTLKNVHWFEQTYTAGGHPPIVTVYGRGEKWRWFAGTLYFRPENVITIAELRDCSPLLEGLSEDSGRSHK